MNKEIEKNELVDCNNIIVMDDDGDGGDDD
jgi:hypothetical protein